MTVELDQYELEAIRAGDPLTAIVSLRDRTDLSFEEAKDTVIAALARLATLAPTLAEQRALEYQLARVKMTKVMP